MVGEVKLFNKLILIVVIGLIFIVGIVYIIL